MKILLMGPVGSGKGTQGELLSKYLKLPVISVGQSLRELPTEHPWYKEINEAMLSGALAPQDKVAEILREKTSRSEFEHGYIMDGWGRTTADLEYFDPGYDKVILINISPEESISRISTRRTCESCGAVYNVISMLPKISDICDKCGGKLIQRDDDKEDAIKKRLQIFRDETKETISRFRNEGKLIEVWGEDSPENIFQNILKSL